MFQFLKNQNLIGLDIGSHTIKAVQLKRTPEQIQLLSLAFLEVPPEIQEEADKAELLRLDYPTHLWLEKEIKSVANVTRRDIGEFLEIAAAIPLRPSVEEYPLSEANRALAELKAGKIHGAKVLRLA